MKNKTRDCSLLTMESTESTRERASGKAVKQDANNMLLMSNNKPLHRFVKHEPKTLGIVIVICGCAEMLMGFPLAKEIWMNSCKIYIPFWQGLLFLVSGNLSIYTQIHPSKKMVTVCMAMYVVSLLGIVVSCGYRIVSLSELDRRHYYREGIWDIYRSKQNLGIECILFTSSLCVSVLLIFLCVITRLSLKSTHTQFIVQHIPAAPQSETTPN